MIAALPAMGAADDIVLTWTVTDSWSTGATVAATLTNSSGTAVSPWAVSITGGPAVSSVWNATLSGASTFKAPTWAPTLAAGGSAQFGVSVSSSTPPASCTVAGHACRVVSAGPSPTPT
ncbi:MAG: cellulose binding domain-containing protein, partial [Actinomycetes bacterium]